MKVASVPLTIMSDGDRTVVEARYHSYEIFVPAVMASSSREPGDKTDPMVGEAKAVARALRKLAKRLEKRADGTIKHREDIKQHAAEIRVRTEEARRRVEEAQRQAPQVVPGNNSIARYMAAWGAGAGWDNTPR